MAGEVLRRQTGDHTAGLGGHHVGAEAALQLGHPGQHVLAGPVLAEVGAIVALFNVDEGEVGVGGEGVGGIGMVGVVPLQIGRTAFLVAAHDELDVVLEGDLQIADGLHGHQGAHHRALVVRHAAAVEHPVLFHAGVGIGIPALAFAHHVQVAQDVKGGVLVVQVSGGHIVFQVFRLKTHLPGQRHALRQGGGGTGAVRLTGGGVLTDALHRHQTGNGGDELGPAGRVVEISVDTLLHKKHSFLSRRCRKKPSALLSLLGQFA